MSFPSILDDAKVLYFTPQVHYGEVRYETGGIADHICYLAICKCDNDRPYYLFGCNEDHEVVIDSSWESIEKCMRAASDFYDCEISWLAAN